MQNFKSFLFIIWFLPNLTYAKNFGMSLGGFFNTKSVFRGAETWPKPSLMAGPSFIFYEKFSLRGPSLSYSHFPRSSQFEWVSSLGLINDGKPLLSIGSHKEDYRNQRHSTWELQGQFKYKFGFLNKFYIGGMLAKDLDETKGLYSELQLGTPGLIKYTSFEYLQSFAESKSNRYFYGRGAISGPGWHEISLKHVIPFVPWKGIVINKLSYSKILQEENKNADYVRGKDNNLVFSSFIIWNIL